MNPESELTEVRAELARAHAEIEKLQNRLLNLECWLQEAEQPTGSRERRVFCSQLVVHAPGEPGGQRLEIWASPEGPQMVMHSGTGEKLMQLADTPDGRGPLLTMSSHSGAETVQIGASTSGGGVVRVANEDGDGLVVLTTDGDAGRVAVRHAKSHSLAALHTLGDKAGVELHGTTGKGAAVFQSTAAGGGLGLFDAEERQRVTVGLTTEGNGIVKVVPPGGDEGILLLAATDKNTLYIRGNKADGDRVALSVDERQVSLDFWSGQQSVMRLASCWLDVDVIGEGDLAGFQATQKDVARGAVLRLSGTNSRELELNPLEVGRQFVLFGDERVPLVSLGAAAGGVQFILNDEIGMPKLQLFARNDGGLIFAHDAEHSVAATLPPDVEFDQGDDDDEEEEEE